MAHAKKKLSQKDFDRMWGDGGPYSQVSLTEQTRILDGAISRVFLVVEASINPFTFEFVLKHRDKFASDLAIQQLLDHAEYRGPQEGYMVMAGEEELIDKKSFETAFSYREVAVTHVIKMHDFVIKEFGLRSYKDKMVKVVDEPDVSSNDKKYVWDESRSEVISVNENVWGDETYVGSPAGSAGEKFRYFIVLVLQGSKFLRREDIKFSADKIKKTAEKFMVGIEKVEAGDGYMMLTVLIGPRTTPLHFIEEVVVTSNERKKLFKSEHFVTSVSRPTGNEIRVFLQGLK